MGQLCQSLAQARLLMAVRSIPGEINLPVLDCLFMRAELLAANRTLKEGVLYRCDGGVQT